MEDGVGPAMTVVTGGSLDGDSFANRTGVSFGAANSSEKWSGQETTVVKP